MVCDDGMEPSEPLNPARVRGIADLVPLSKKEIKPDSYDYLNYRNPELYRISTSKSLANSNDLQYLLVHHSRILRLDGLYLPWRERLNNSGWGLSALQVFYEPWKRYRGATDGPLGQCLARWICLPTRFLDWPTRSPQGRRERSKLV